MPRVGRTFRIFVSSTFSDLKEERNALQARVFPRLRELCGQHGARFQAIDLRWGVSQEASRDQQTMNICLREIERSQEVSPRPNFIVLLGDRYGWCPPPLQIPADEFEQIHQYVDAEDAKLLDEWYRRDDNAVPPEYCLQPWKDSYEGWSSTEKRLHDILARAAEALAFNEEDRLKYVASATHQEIAAGALQVEDADEHVYCSFREIEGMPGDERATGWRDLDAGVPDRDAQRRLESLKKEVRRRLPGNIYKYKAQWNDDQVSTDHIDRLCDDVLEALTGVIKRELDSLEEQDPLDAEVAAHAKFGAERAKFFTGRTSPLATIAGYLSGPVAHPLAIWGESGSGKSALIAKAVKRAQQARPEAEIIFRFIGATPESSGGRVLLESLCRQISHSYNSDEADIPLEYWELVQEFRRRLSLATADKPLILFLDALDQLADADNVRSLAWLPAELPDNVRLVVSTTPGDTLEALMVKLPEENRGELLPMPTDEAELLLDRWLADAGRALQLEQRMEVIDKYAGCPKPLYLRLAFEEARRWKSYDGLPTGAGDVPGLNGDIPGIIRDLFARLSDEANHGELLASRSLGYLAAGRHGLAEDELLAVLARDVEVYTWFLANSYHLPSDLVRQTQAYLAKHPDAWREGRGGKIERGLARLFRHFEKASAPDEATTRAWLSELLQEGRTEEDSNRVREFLTALIEETGAPRLPVILWSRLYADLEPYLTERAVNDASLLGFFHRQVAEVVGEEYLSGKNGVERHKALAGYFGEQALQLEDTANLRKLAELPYQQAHSQQWEALQATLTDFDFLYAKVNAVGPQPLIEDYDMASTGGYQQDDLRMIQGALRLSAHVIQEDPTLLAGQLLGRLSADISSAIRNLRRQARHYTGAAWLRPLTNSLVGTGGPLVASLFGHTNMVEVMVMTPDGRIGVSGARDNLIKVWNLESGEELFVLEGHTHYGALAISADGQTILSSVDGLLKLWDLRDSVIATTLSSHKSSRVAMLPDGSRALIGDDRVLRVWDLAQKTEVLTWTAHLKRITSVAITPDARRAFSASEDRTVKVWNLLSGELEFVLQAERPPHPDSQVANMFHPSLSIAISDDGQRCILRGTKRNGLRFWDLREGTDPHSLPRKQRADGLAVTSDGSRVVSAEYNSVLVWELDADPTAHVVKHLSSGINALTMTPDGTSVWAGTDDGMLHLLNLEHVNKVDGPGKREQSPRINTLVTSPTGRYFASGSVDGTVKLWKAAKEKERHGTGDLQTTRRSVIRRGKPQADVFSGIESVEIRAHQSAISALATTPDGRYLISAASEGDGTIRVWDVASKKCVRIFHNPSAVAQVVNVTPDGRYLLAGLRIVDSSPRSAVNPVVNVGVGAVQMWELEGGEESFYLDLRPELPMVTDIAPQWMGIPARGDCAVLGSSSCIMVLDLERRELTDAKVSSYMGITPDARYLFFNAKDGVGVQPVNAESARFLLPGKASSMRRIGFAHSSSHFVVIVSAGRMITLWDLRERSAITDFYCDNRIQCCTLTPDGKMIMIGDCLGGVHILKLENVRLREVEVPSPARTPVLRPMPQADKTPVQKEAEQRVFRMPTETATRELDLKTLSDLWYSGWGTPASVLFSDRVSWKRGETLCRWAGNEQLLASFVLGEAILVSLWGEHEWAMVRLQEAGFYGRAAANIPTLVGALFYRASLLIERSDAEIGMPLWEEATRLRKQQEGDQIWPIPTHNQPVAESELLRLWREGREAYLSGQIETALDKWVTGAKRSWASGTWSKLPPFLLGEGTVCIVKNRYERARVCFQKAQIHARLTGDLTFLAAALSSEAAVSVQPWFPGTPRPIPGLIPGSRFALVYEAVSIEDNDLVEARRLLEKEANVRHSLEAVSQGTTGDDFLLVEKELLFRLMHEGGEAFATGKREEAISIWRRGEQLCRWVGNQQLLAGFLVSQGAVLAHTQYRRALKRLQEGEFYSRRIDDVGMLGDSLYNQAVAEVMRGDREAAHILFREAVDCYQEAERRNPDAGYGSRLEQTRRYEMELRPKRKRSNSGYESRKKR